MTRQTDTYLPDVADTPPRPLDVEAEQEETLRAHLTEEQWAWILDRERTE